MNDRTKYEVMIWYDAAQTPDQMDRQPTHTERERLDSLPEAIEFIEDELWQVDDIENSGTDLPDGRKEYGYWSKAKDRQTGKQWYQWATVEIRKLEIEKLDASEVIK